MDLAEALKDLGRRYGAGGPADGDGAAGPGRATALLLDGRAQLIVDHDPEGGAVFLRIPMDLPEREFAPPTLAALYRRLLAANLLGEATRGAVISLDPDAERLEVHRRVPLGPDLDGRLLAARIDELYGVADHLATEHGLSFVGEEPAGDRNGAEAA